MAKAFGIISSSDNSIYVRGLNDYRPIGAISFLGRFRVIDFPISNMSNSGMNRIQVYVTSRPRSIAEHTSPRSLMTTTGIFLSIKTSAIYFYLIIAPKISEVN